MSHDAVAILTGGKVRELTGASREISPMQWVDADENTSARRERFCTRTRQAQGSKEQTCRPQTTEGLRTDLPTGNVESHNFVCNWCAQIPKREATSGANLASRLFIYGTEGQELESRTLCCKNSRIAKKNTERRVTLHVCTDGCSGEEISPMRYCASQCFLLTTTPQPYSDIYSRYAWVHSNVTTSYCVSNTTDSDYRRRAVRPDTRSHCEQGISRKIYPTVSCLDCKTDTSCFLTQYFEDSKYVRKLFASEVHVCWTTSWNTRHSFLRAASILISKSS